VAMIYLKKLEIVMKHPTFSRAISWLVFSILDCSELNRK
jgi:hypothetical protein